PSAASTGSFQRLVLIGLAGSAAGEPLDDRDDAKHGQDRRIEENRIAHQPQAEPDDADENQSDPANDGAGLAAEPAGVPAGRPLRRAIILVSFHIAAAAGSATSFPTIIVFLVTITLTAIIVFLIP